MTLKLLENTCEGRQEFLEPMEWAGNFYIAFIHLNSGLLETPILLRTAVMQVIRVRLTKKIILNMERFIIQMSLTCHFLRIR